MSCVPSFVVVVVVGRCSVDRLLYVWRGGRLQLVGVRPARRRLAFGGRGCFMGCEECGRDGVCNGCWGNGRVLARFGGPWETCASCGGSGRCPECGGRGRVRVLVAGGLRELETAGRLMGS